MKAPVINELKNVNLGESGSKIDWSKFKIDLSNPVIPPEPLIIQSDTNIPMLHRRNISTIAAQAKVGKTFLICAIAAAALAKKSFMNMHCRQHMKVLFIDTEQDISDTQELSKRICRINCWCTDVNNQNLTVLNLRESSIEERKSLIEDAMIDLRPDLVLLDGIVDLIDNFNDISESKNIVETLTKWSTKYNCHIITVLHVNKGTTELRGHLGSFLRQKGELTLLLTKHDGVVPYIEVKPVDSRHRSIDVFYFRINENVLPEIYKAETKPSRINLLEDIFEKIFSKQNSLRYNELANKVMEFGRVKKDAAKKWISEAFKNKIITKNESGLYILKQNHIENNELSIEDNEI